VEGLRSGLEEEGRTGLRSSLGNWFLEKGLLSLGMFMPIWQKVRLS
jgi:hypothetical protein